METFDSSTLERLAAFVRQHPFAGAVLVAMALLLMLGALFLLFVGTICSYLDDAKAGVRLGALIRIGRRVGLVLRDNGKDVALLLFGEKALVVTGTEAGAAPEPSDKP